MRGRPAGTGGGYGGAPGKSGAMRQILRSLRTECGAPTPEMHAGNGPTCGGTARLTSLYGFSLSIGAPGGEGWDGPPHWLTRERAEGGTHTRPVARVFPLA
jgi:hypothetical protein